MRFHRYFRLCYRRLGHRMHAGRRSFNRFGLNVFFFNSGRSFGLFCFRFNFGLRRFNRRGVGKNVGVRHDRLRHRKVIGLSADRRGRLLRRRYGRRRNERLGQ